MNRLALLALFAYTASAQGIYPASPENWNVVCDNTHASVQMPDEAVLGSTEAFARQRNPVDNSITQPALLQIVYTVGPQPRICNINSNAQDDLAVWNLAVRFGLPDAGSDGEVAQLGNPDYRHFGTRLDAGSADGECSTSGEFTNNPGIWTSRLNQGGAGSLAISADTSHGAGAAGWGEATISVNLDGMGENCDHDRWSIDGTPNTAAKIYQAPNGVNPFGPNQYGCESFYVPVSVMWEEEGDRGQDGQDHPKLVVSVIIVEVSFCPVYDRTVCITWVPEMELVYPVYAEVDSVMPIHDGGKNYHIDYDFEVRVENPGPDGDLVRARDLFLVEHCMAYNAVDRISGNGQVVPGFGTNLRQVATTLDHTFAGSQEWLGGLAANSPGDSASWAQNTRFGWETASQDFSGVPANFFANCIGSDMFSGTQNNPTADLCFAFGLESCTDDTAASCFPIDLPHPMRFCYKLPVTIFYADEAENITFNLADNEPTLLVWEEQGHLLNSYGEGGAYLAPGSANHDVNNFRGAAGAGIGNADGVYNPNWLDAAVPSELDKRGILQRRNQLSLATYFAPFVQQSHAGGLHAGVHAGHDHQDWTSVDVDLWIQPSSLKLHSLCDDGTNHGVQILNTNEHAAISEVEQDRQFAVFSTPTSRDWGVPPETNVATETAAWYSHYPKRYCSGPDATQGRRSSGSYVADTNVCWGASGKQIKLPMVTTYEQGGYGFNGIRHDNVDGFSLNTYWTLHNLFTDSQPGSGLLGSKNPNCALEQVNKLKVSGHVQVVHWGNYNNNNNYPPRRALLGIQKSDFSMSNAVDTMADSLSEKQRRLLQQGDQQVNAGEKGTGQETVILLGQEEAAQPPAMIGPIVPIAAGGAVSLCCCFFLMAARRRSKKNKVKAFNKYKGEAFSAKVVDTAVVQIQAQNDVASVA